MKKFGDFVFVVFIMFIYASAIGIVLEGIGLIEVKNFGQEDKTVAETSQVTKLKINIDAEEIEYYHLGTDIKKEYTCNYIRIQDGDVIPYRDKLTFVAKITEQDSIDDVGSGTVTMYAPYNVKRSVNVRVDEAGGRKYPDAYAVWKVTFEIEPIYE